MCRRECLAGEPCPSKAVCIANERKARKTMAEAQAAARARKMALVVRGVRTA